MKYLIALILHPMSKQGKIWSCLDTQLDVNATEKILVTKIIILCQRYLDKKKQKLEIRKSFERYTYSTLDIAISIYKTYFK